AKANGLPDKQARDVAAGNPGAELEGFTVGKPLHPKRVTQSKTLPHQAINMRLRPGPEPDSGIQIERNCFARFSATGQTVGTGILRRKTRITLHNVRVLNMP